MKVTKEMREVAVVKTETQPVYIIEIGSPEIFDLRFALYLVSSVKGALTSPHFNADERARLRELYEAITNAGGTAPGYDEYSDER